MPKKYSIKNFIASSFFRGMSVYMFGNVISASLPFMLMPVMTRLLTPTDYGIIGTAIPILQFFVMLLGINASGLIARDYFNKNPKELTRLVSTASWLSLILTSFLFLIAIAADEFIETWTKFPASWLPVIVLMALFKIMCERYLVVCQARMESKRFVLINILQCVSDLVLSILFIVALRMNWHGRIIAKTLSLCMVSAIACYGLVFRLKLLRFTFSINSLRNILSFGIPLIPHVIGGWVLTMSAPLFLNKMVSVSSTGLYYLAFNIVSPLMMIIGAAQRSYQPILFETLTKNENFNPIRLCQILVLTTIALPLIGALYGLSSYIFIPILAGPLFKGSAPYVFWLSLMASMHGVYYIFANFVIFAKKTKLMIWRTDLLGALVLIISCPILIHLNGGIGVAQAVFLGMTATAIGCISAAIIAYSMPWRLSVLTLYAKFLKVVESRT